MAKTTDPAEQEVTLNLNQLAELVRQMTSQGQMTAEVVASIAAKAAIEAGEALAGKWWDVVKYPGVSAFNPLGEKAHPRPELAGDIYWSGYLIKGDECTREEIDLLNQLRPGSWLVKSRGGNDLPVVVRDLDPGSRDSRRLLVAFPSSDADQRSDVPSMVDMLTQMLRPVAA